MWWQPARRNKSPKCKALTRASSSRPCSPSDVRTRMRLNSRRAQVDGRKAIVVLFLVVSGFFGRTILAQKHPLEEVASGLKHQDAPTRLRAIQILKDADYPEAAVPIAAVLGDADDRVQLAALDAERSLFTSRLIPRRRKIGFVIE